MQERGGVFRAPEVESSHGQLQIERQNRRPTCWSQADVIVVELVVIVRCSQPYSPDRWRQERDGGANDQL